MFRDLDTLCFCRPHHVAMTDTPRGTARLGERQIALNARARIAVLLIILPIASVALGAPPPLDGPGQRGKPSSPANTAKLDAKVDDAVALTPQQVTALIRQLGDADFATRETATQSLVRAGVAVVPQVLKATESENGETALRATEVLKRIELSCAERLRRKEIPFDTTVKVDPYGFLPGWLHPR